MTETIMYFLRGMGSLLDINGSLLSQNPYPLDGDPAEQDLKALESDWQAVGESIREAMGYEQKSENSSQTDE